MAFGIFSVNLSASTLAIGFGALLTVLNVVGMVRAYRAGGAGWKNMDRDVKVVFLLVLPIVRCAGTALLLADRLLYRPKTERIQQA